jgi:hypothetical protein
VKATKALTVLCSARIPANRLNIHPNEGADIGLMMTRHSASTEGGASIEVCLLNECPKESVEINAGLWERLGKPSKVVLGYEDGRLEITRA